VSSGAALCASSGGVKFFLKQRASPANALCFVWRPWAAGLLLAASAFQGGRVLLKQVLSLASRSNSALVSDACASALRAFFSAPQRGR
jgi:hypothetical protein